MRDGLTIVTVGVEPQGRTTDWWSVDVASGTAWPMGAAEAFKPAGFTDVGQPDAVMNNCILFSVDADSRVGLWSIALTADGRAPRGEPQRLTASMRCAPTSTG